VTQARACAPKQSTWDRNWGNTTLGGGCRYELNLAHVCAEVRTHRSRPDKAHFNERRAFTLAWGKGFLADFRNRTGPDSREAKCLEEFQQNLSGRTCSRCDPTTRSLCPLALAVKIGGHQFTASLNF
jgi:hypothetical protein